MEIRVLAIGDVANNAEMLRKYLKKIKIHIVHFPYKYKTVFLNDNEEYFTSFNILESVKKIRAIKENYDLCFVTSWAGARIAYLAGLNYIIYFVGTDIQVPPFVKKSDLQEMKIPVFNHNYLERLFYKRVLDNAIACVTSSEPMFISLKKFRSDAIRIDRILVDLSLFDATTNITDITDIQKTKFTFFSPQRFTYYKGLDLICKAIALCKSDFEILQVKWFDDPSEEGNEIMRELIKDLPTQFKMIPVIKRNDMAKYYNFADAVLGQMRSGILGSVEREGALCKKPVVFYYNTNYKYRLDGINVTAPFLPNSNNVEEIAKTIDRIVTSQEFRQELVIKQYEFVKELCDPEKAAREWDILFTEMYSKYQKIQRESSLIIFLRKLLFILGYALHKQKILRKIKSIFV